MRSLNALVSLTLFCACGGQPVGGKVPKVDPAEAAGVAAAAAALVTLADPDNAKKIQERRGGGRPGKTKENHEQVPEEVLHRAEDHARAKAIMDANEANEEEGAPCQKTSESPEAKDGTTKQRIELIPSAEPAVPPEPLKPCVQENEDAIEEATESSEPSVTPPER